MSGLSGTLFEFVEHLSAAPLINYLNNDSDFSAFDADLELSSERWANYPTEGVSDFSCVSDIFTELDMFFGEQNVLNHDCMWAGHCGGQEHADEPTLSGFIPKPPVICEQKSATVALNTQESLLKPSVKAMGTTFTQQNSSLQTPPDSDDDTENKVNSALLRLMSVDSTDCDSDFVDYLIGEKAEVKKEEPEMKEEIDIDEENVDMKEEPEDTESETESKQMSCEEYRIRTQWAAENDHSYYKDKNAAMINNNYGMDTPSDSEDEEIDVVSIPDKYMTDSARTPLSLPTNPSFKDRHHLQKTMASAMTKNRSSSGIKTILPVRNGESQSTGKAGRRGVKRGRVGRASTTYKRRRANNIVDAEPTDKRHLHNDMERQRRVDLRIAFDNLKAVVPEVSGTKKIAKVNILLQAAQYCYHLTNVNANNIKQMEQLKNKQVWLRSRVSQLRREVAARR